MKKIAQKHSNLYTYFLAIFLFGVALFVSTLINKGILKAYFPYASVILLAIVTWFLHKRENKSLSELGLNFILKNIALLPLGLLIGAGAFLMAKYIRAICLGEVVHINPEADYTTILYSLYIILPTVATEEFLFRGYLFKKTIEVSSVLKANIIFSVLFMLIHVIDGEVLKSPGVIILLVISIPVGHLLFATALLKSKTLFFPIGIHLGNNWATRHLITTNNDGNSLFYITNKAVFDSWPSFIAVVLLWNCIFLAVTLIIWKWDYFSFRKLLKKNNSVFL